MAIVNTETGVALTQCISCIPSTSNAYINSLWLAKYLSHSVLDLKLKISVLCNAQFNFHLLLATLSHPQVYNHTVLLQITKSATLILEPATQQPETNKIFSNIF